MIRPKFHVPLFRNGEEVWTRTKSKYGKRKTAFVTGFAWNEYHGLIYFLVDKKDDKRTGRRWVTEPALSKKTK
jgi:hypothetical protein